MTEELCGVFNGETALIADDDEFFRELLEALLTFAGIEVVAKEPSGDKALLEFLKHQPQMVFLDINMPGVNGLDALSQIKSISPSTLVFVISGETTRENLLKAISDKADAIIAKPFNFAQVIEKVQAAVESPGGFRRIPSFAG